MIVHLVDGTDELFRHFYGLRRAKGADLHMGAVAGVLHTVAQMMERGATHVGVATDHVIESFRNELWSGYKTGEGIEPALHAQFHPREDALSAMGVAVWPMVDLEADDALASAAHIAAGDARVQKMCIWARQGSLPMHRRRSGRANGPAQQHDAQCGRRACEERGRQPVQPAGATPSRAS